MNIKVNIIYIFFYETENKINIVFFKNPNFSALAKVLYDNDIMTFLDEKVLKSHLLKYLKSKIIFYKF